MIDWNRLERMLALLDRVRYPVDLSFDHRGDALAVAVFPAHHDEGSSYQSRIWRVALDGDVRQLTFGPRSDAMPRWSPIDDRLAFASEAPVVGRMSLFLRRAEGGAAQIGDMAGSVQQVAWARAGRSLNVVAVDEGG